VCWDIRRDTINDLDHSRSCGGGESERQEGKVDLAQEGRSVWLLRLPLSSPLHWREDPKPADQSQSQEEDFPQLPVRTLWPFGSKLGRPGGAALEGV
jgi:hypothetical protein